jgi:hypothetical protein
MDLVQNREELGQGPAEGAILFPLGSSLGGPIDVQASQGLIKYAESVRPVFQKNGLKFRHFSTLNLSAFVP